MRVEAKRTPTAPPITQSSECSFNGSNATRGQEAAMGPQWHRVHCITSDGLPRRLDVTCT